MGGIAPLREQQRAPSEEQVVVTRLALNRGSTDSGFQTGGSFAASDPFTSPTNELLASHALRKLAVWEVEVEVRVCRWKSSLRGEKRKSWGGGGIWQLERGSWLDCECWSWSVWRGSSREKPVSKGSLDLQIIPKDVLTEFLSALRFKYRTWSLIVYRSAAGSLFEERCTGQQSGPWCDLFTQKLAPFPYGVGKKQWHHISCMNSNICLLILGFKNNIHSSIIQMFG